MRPLFCFSLALIAAASHAQGVRVTYSTVAVSTKKVLADLSLKTGAKLESTPGMDSEVLILKLQDAPLEDVLKRIASVTSGAWEQRGDIRYLIADGNLRRQEEATAQRAFADRIAKQLKTHEEDLKKSPSDSSGPSPFPFMMGAGNLSVIKLAIAVGAGPLATVPPGGRVVFSTRPNRTQRALPANAGPILNEFVIAHNKSAALARNAEPARNDGVPEEARAFLNLFGNRPKPKTITGPPAKALLVATRAGLFGGYSLKLKLFDADGQVLASATAPLNVDSAFDFGELMRGPQAAAAPTGVEIKLSALSQELYNAGRSFSTMGGSSNLKMTQSLNEHLRDPVEHDPLSYVHSEALIAVADHKKAQLVANLPDGVLSFMSSMRASGKLTTDGYVAEVKKAVKIEEADGWMTVSPLDPVEARRERTDRPALRELIRVALAKGYVGLDDQAAYAVKNGSPMDGAPASTMYLITFAPNTMQQGMMGVVNWDLLRFYGMLSATQRRSLREGGQIPFGRLSPTQQAQLSKMLFGADTSLTVLGEKKPGDALTEMITRQVERFMGSADTDFRTEPTEVMPNGLPANGYVNLDLTTEPVAQAETMSSDFGRMSSLSSLELGLLKFFQEDPRMSQMAGMMPTLDDLRVGSRSVYNFGFFVAPSICEKQSLNDDQIPKEAKVYKLNALPADFQKRINDMSAQMKKNPVWQMIGSMGFGRQAPPP